MTDAEWIEVLREECKRTSQNKVARLIGMSQTTINQVLKGTYTGRLDRIEARVMGALMKQTHDCPVLGAISKKRCQDHQARPFATTNPTRVALYMACRKGCKHSKLGSES